MSYENAIYQWHSGERRLKQAAPEQRFTLERVTEALVAELRRRLGGRFSTAELIELYDSSAAWCLQLAMNTAPQDPWAWEAGIVIDAAFGRYLRGAHDYAGGRRALAE